MADGLNRVILLGHLGQDPELKTTPGGQAVLNIRLATTETYFDKNQTKQERTDWHTVVVWGKRAEGLAKFLTKGMQILIEGRIQTRTYEKNGEKRYATDINAQNVVVCEKKGASQGGGARKTSAPATGGGGSQATSDDFSNSADDDEIPFAMAADDVPHHIRTPRWLRW